ncbi:MAG: element excision factor XisH family protein [Nostoc sp.]
MPAKDIFHNIVKTALEKDKWTITDEHLFIQVEDIDFYIDLTAERILAAEKTGKKIAVELKKNSAILNSGAEPETLRRGVRIKTLADSLAAGAISRGFRPRRN